MDISQILLIVLSSAGFSTIASGLFHFANRVLDEKQKKREKEYLCQEKYKEKKEKVYIAALERLLQIRRGFDYTLEDAIRDKIIREEIDRGNSAFIEISPQLRLYSSDYIFNKWQFLARGYSKFAYAHSGEERLFEESKWAYDIQITMLARQMQDDLGYREFNKFCDIIICPECGSEHDLVSKCPRCGLTFEELQEKCNQIMAQMQEIQKEKNNNQ